MGLAMKRSAVGIESEHLQADLKVAIALLIFLFLMVRILYEEIYGAVVSVIP